MAGKKLTNDTFLRALNLKPTEHTPIWLMRQAGRYLPEYKKIRKLAGSFLTLAQTPELAAEVTMQPIQRFPDLDAAILFSDILTIPDAMGLELSFDEGEGPKFAKPLRTEKDICNISIPSMGLLQYVFDAIKEVSVALTFGGEKKIPLIGFSGSPFTLACYMLEGRSKTNFAEIRRFLYTEPTLLRYLLSINEKTISAYLKKQIDAGVDAVMIFDTWGGLLNRRNFEDFSLYYIRNIIREIKSKVPIIIFTKGGIQYLQETLTACADAYGIDWTIDPASARLIINGGAGIQGNLDPAILLSTTEVIHHQVSLTLDAFGKEPGHIFNLGHGVLPETPVENVQFLIKEVHSLSIKNSR